MFYARRCAPILVAAPRPAKAPCPGFRRAAYADDLLVCPARDYPQLQLPRRPTRRGERRERQQRAQPDRERPRKHSAAARVRPYKQGHATECTGMPPARIMAHAHTPNSILNRGASQQQVPVRAQPRTPHKLTPTRPALDSDAEQGGCNARCAMVGGGGGSVF